MASPVMHQIEIDEAGVAWIAGKGLTVEQLVASQVANGWTVEELQQRHPELSPAEVHAALAYYFDHEMKLRGEVTGCSKSTPNSGPLGRNPLLDVLGCISTDSLSAAEIETELYGEDRH